MRFANPPRTAGEWLLLILPFLALLSLLIPTYYNVAIGLWRYEEHAYAPLLALVAFALLWRGTRDICLAPHPVFPAWGWIVLIAGIAGYVLGRSQKIELIELLAGIPLVAGYVAVIGGPQALKKLRFPLFFLVFSVPYPPWVVETLTNPLKIFISFMAESLLYNVGYPVARNGVILALGPYRMLVADACSGLHSLIFLTALGLLYIHLTCPPAPVWRRFILFSALVPIAVLANFVRVMTLVLSTYYFGDSVAQGAWHVIAGLLLFVSAFAGLFGLDSMLNHIGGSTGWQSTADRFPASDAPHPSASPIISLKSSLFLTVLLLSANVTAVLLAPHHLLAGNKVVPMLKALIPENFGDWHHAERTDSILISPILQDGSLRQYSQTLLRTYVNGSGQGIMLTIAYGTNQVGHEFQAHRPEACYKAQGFALMNWQETDIRLGSQLLKVRQLVAQHNRRTEPITYWMTIDDKATLPGVPRKIEQLRYGLRGIVPDGMLIRVSCIDSNIERAFALQTRFITDLHNAVPGNLGFTR